jgi:hypothetical protein
MSGVKLSENAARIVAEQVQWARNVPRQQPPPQDPPVWQSNNLACFELQTALALSGNEYAATGKFVMWNDSSQEYTAVDYTDVPQKLWYPAAPRKSNGSAAYVLPLMPAQRVWGVFRGRWEIVAPGPTPTPQGTLAADLVAGTSPDSHAQVNVTLSDGSSAAGGPFNALNLFNESGSSGDVCVLILNTQTATQPTYPYILLRVVPKLMTAYQPGYDGQGNWTSIAQTFYAGGSSAAGSATPYYTGAAAGSDLQRDATSTSVSVSSSSINYGDLVNLSATVSHTAGTGDPTGTVVFFRDGLQTPLGGTTGGLSGFGWAGNVFTLGNVFIPVGTYRNITAVYGGDASYNTSASSAASLTVAGCTPTVTLSAAAPTGTSNPNTYGSNLTLTATLTYSAGSAPGPTGQVIFYNTVSGNDVAISLPCRVTFDGTNYTAVYTLNNLPAGSLSLKAVYQADANFHPATGTLTQVVNKAQLTVTANDASMVHGNNPPSFTGAATYAGWVLDDTRYGGQVTGQPSLTTTADSSSPAGTYPITAAAGTLASNNYSFTFNNGTLTVT